MTPTTTASAVAGRLAEFGLPTKPPEPLTLSRALGLQLGVDSDGEVWWRRRDDSDIELPKQPTKRNVFSWCGHLTGHLPVCGWLRPFCSFLKRMANESGSWDQVISDRVLLDFCDEGKIKLAGGGDPARGLWSAKVGDSTECTVWTDDSDPPRRHLQTRLLSAVDSQTSHTPATA